MSDHPGEAGKKGMPKLDRDYLEDFVTLLEKADIGGTAGFPEEPLPLHLTSHSHHPFPSRGPISDACHGDHLKAFLYN